MKDLAKRFVVSLISIVVVTLILVFAHKTFFNYFVALFVAVLSAISAAEYIALAIAKRTRPNAYLLMGLCALVTMSFFGGVELKQLPEWCLFFSVLMLFALHFRSTEGSILNLAVSCFGLLYIGVPLGMILGIIYFPGAEDGRMWAAYLLAVTKLTDIGAYFAGNLWGKRKLAKNISPGKTIEGALCGLVTAVAVSCFFYFLGKWDDSLQFHLGPLEWIFLGIVLGSVGQFGDLAESLLKRDAQKKDSNSLPGIGGALDSVDSLLFTAPIIYLYLNALRLM